MTYFFKNFYFKKQEQEIIKNSKVVTNFIFQALEKNNSRRISNLLKLTAELNSGQTWLVDKEGYVILSYPAFFEEKNKKVTKFDIDEILAGNIISRRIQAPYFERPMLLVGMPITVKDTNEVRGGLMVFTSVAGINSTINQLKKMLFFSSILAILLAVVIAYKWADDLAAPLRKISNTALELSNGKFGKQVEIEEEGEIGTLAESMNYLSQELKTTVEALIREKNKLRHVLASMEEGLLVIDCRKNVLLYNDSVKKLLNINKENLKNKKLDKIINKKEIKKLFLKVLEEGAVKQDEISISNSKTRHILINCAPIYKRKQESQLEGVVGVVKDISERWKFEQLQKSFVTNVSHELKAPLSSIKGSVEILLDEVVTAPEKKGEYLTIILEETNRLAALVDELLVLAEYDKEKIGFKSERIAVKELLRNSRSVFNKSVSGEGIINLVLPKRELYVNGDKEKLKQVLLNLLDNAYKFSPTEKNITVGVKEQEERMKFWVSDEGIGIPGDELENIWERFVKVDKARTPTKRNGSGLGLAIVKQIIEGHGGEVFVESQLGEGTTFGFYLPK